ncbi:hypothetical protein, variant [Exophiala mesophila]|uniref:Methyltransferase n=1 Tax=Exophiala mesophila TaxID=212818 RepID=A0A0D1ZFX7_EXOME|nr:uncharacterized protein PV10_04032 [Exophiala mesophila]XP_016224339.1 hypothetical protein, variant [Exophiala mesophila]KIV92764.1 hypothetical protein PV10_04032 [Exophiala mesophila]KIV92765.1 hypothetical protein, variant [Exophiala mesophila]
MPAVRATLEFLAKSPLYETEKPYLYLPGKDEDIDLDNTRLDNMEYESHANILIRDMRETPDLCLDQCGFEYTTHDFSHQALESRQNIVEYCSQINDLLAHRFKAERVVTYEHRLRKNEMLSRTEFDVYDPLLVEGPAKGAHNDVTFSSGPAIINRHLTQEDKSKYLQPGYRFRVFNTWRPLNAVLEDRPLALCDTRTVAPSDLVAADRILPDRIGEVYYLQHSHEQQWYWLEKQRSNELLVFLEYDTQSEKTARFCPHVSFDLPHAPDQAEKRRSIETRSIVITKLWSA